MAQEQHAREIIRRHDRVLALGFSAITAALLVYGAFLSLLG
jgi:hypothetical protein